MNNDNLIEFETPETTETFTDTLIELVRQGAQQIIAQAEGDILDHRISIDADNPIFGLAEITDVLFRHIIGCGSFLHIAGFVNA